MGTTITIVSNSRDFEPLVPPEICIRYEVKRLGRRVEVMEWFTREEYIKLEHNLKSNLLGRYLNTKKL